MLKKVVNYRLLDRETLNKLEIICTILFMDFKKIRITRRGNVKFIRKNGLFFKKGKIVSIPDLLLKDIPDMLSIRKWGSYDLSLQYSIAISSIIKNKHKDVLQNIQEVVNYLYQELLNTPIVDIRGNINTKIVIPTIPKVLGSKRAQKLETIEQEEFTSRNLLFESFPNKSVKIHDIQEEQAQVLTAKWHDIIYSLKYKAAIIALSVSLSSSMNNTNTTGLIKSILMPLFHYNWYITKNLSYYFNTS